MKLNAFTKAMPNAWLPKRFLINGSLKRQIAKTMKLTTLLLIVALMQVSAKGFSQKINLNATNVPLEKVLHNIESQTGYVFFFDSKLVKQNVSVKVSDASITDALTACLKGSSLTFQIADKTIFIRKKKEQVPAPNVAPVDKTIKGSVVDTTGTTIPGATIKVKNSGLSVMTDGRGEFTLTVPDNAVLVISSIGFESREVFVPADGQLRVVLHQSVSKLDEVQVIAYGTTTHRLSTGDITTVKAAEIENQPVSNPMAALQGRVAGLVITQTSGVAGSAFKIQLRGQSSLDRTLSQTNPLFIIDGVPFESGNSISNQINSAANNPVSVSSGGLSPLNSINPQDIESIDVLKDADATAIYGSRGANGVILITTKKGKPGRTVVNINANSGVSKVSRTMDMLNTQQYVQIRKEALANDGLVPSTNPSDPGYAPDITLWDTSRYTDFKKLLIGNTAKYTNIQGSISGGNNNTQFRIGGNYHRETTVYSDNFADKIGSFNVNLNHTSLNGKFNLQFSSIFSSDNNQLPATDLTKFVNLPPNLLLYNNAGNLNWQDNGVTFASLNLTNPLAVFNKRYTSTNDNLSSNLGLNYTIISGLVIKANLGYNAFNVNEHSAIPSTAIDATTSTLPSSEFGNSTNKSWIIEPQIQYARNFFFGKFDFLIGSTFQEKSGRSSYQYGTNYNSDLLLNSIAAAGVITAKNDAALYHYNAFFGRINYNYEDKYIVNITGRRDGSSRFGPDKQWANFGAIGLVWIFTSESFLKDQIPFLSFGKLRGSYGTTGNDQIGDYKYLNLWTNTTNGYNGIPGLTPQSLYNPNYRWEVNKKLEAAIELGFLRDRILVNVDYYRNRSSNQLIRYSLPNQTGFSSVIKNFPGLVQNTGIELSVNTRNITTPSFNWTTAFNISIPKNKLISFPGLSTSSYANQYVEGKSLSVIRGFKYLGVDPQTGLYTFEDVNKDGQIYDGDYQYFGNTDPKFLGGLQNTITYKKIELSFFFQFTKQTGANYISQLASSSPGSIINQPSLILGRWRAPGDNSEIQKVGASFDSPANSTIAALSLSNGAYTDASFIKLKNVALSYSLPASILQPLKVSKCRLYLEMQNVFTLTNYKGADPEQQNFYALPPLRTIVAGLQLNF
ncbi:TonB-linked outer membrane protein, SusC/RagA family [Mucilaginibacter pineti]|uniref:TonB-linked outer membrane protein, SusC/RagA family n=1 Tax=Mucilaginibacter pineti TaxID=1391627 RepID=A0A1G7NBD8_9SPHI|nr:TonB-dependent receptor [Mucilaginibacter pineti]SDF70679.1 TonB-linked outer membrane protein, SusC/RagA family [Mucilaginibacter pineti]